MLRLFRYFFFLLPFLHLQAQDHGFFNQVWLEQGLSQSSIISMVQDRQGFMWFATQDGLNRYDGRNIDHFNLKPFDKQSISGDDIYSVSLHHNDLYVLTDKGLDKIDLSAMKIFNLKQRNEGNRPPFFKSWMLGGQLYLFNREGLVRVTVSGDNSYQCEPCDFIDSLGSKRPMIFGICEDDKGRLYAATSQGIFVQPGKKEAFRKLIGLAPAASKEESERFYNAITWKSNKLYFASAQALFSYDLPDSSLTSIAMNGQGPVSSIIVDKQNKIWTGTVNKGVFIFEESAGKLELRKHYTSNIKSRFTLQSNEITCIYQNPASNDNIVWIGTRDAGAFSYSYSKNSFSIPSSFVSFPDLNFFGVTKDRSGIIWTGFTSGILKIDREKKKYSVIDLHAIVKRSSRPIEALCCDRDNTLWMAYGNELFQIDKENNGIVPKALPLLSDKPANISRITDLSADELLLCTSRGLLRYNKKSGSQVLTATLSVNGQVQQLENTGSFLQDRAGNWWIGTVNGLYCIRKDQAALHFRHDHQDSASILSNRIMDIKESPAGEIVVATTKGLSMISSKGQLLRNIYSAKGLPNNFIYGLLQDHSGRLWMSTNFGIAVFNPATGGFKSYTASDGICINEFNSSGFFRAEDGELIFAGLGGLVSVYPEKQVVNKSVSDIVLRKMRIEEYHGSEVPSGLIALSYGQNDLHFEFSVPDYSGEKNVNLFYRFSNKDSSWIKANPSQLFSLTFVDLAPGRYDLEVIAQNKEGARSAPFRFSFSIGDPFWSTWWFYFILVTITLLSSWLIYRVRLKRKIAYIQQIEQIRKDENEKVRKAAALDLHDEFGNGLTRISMLIEMIKIHIAHENSEAHKLLDLITQNANRLYHGTKDFIWSINPGKDNMYEIAIRIKDYADEIFYGTNVTFELNGLKEELKHIRQSPTAGRNIAMIFKESLSNVLKHAKADHVNFTVSNGGDKIYLRLKDNGKGFEMKNGKNSFGITNIQQRASRLSAQININSELNQGTEVVLVLNRNGYEYNSQNTQADHHRGG